MKAIIKLNDIPDWQIGEKVQVFFPDTMCKYSICEKEDIGKLEYINYPDNPLMGFYRCSKCKTSIAQDISMITHATKSVIKRYKYCYNCGSKNVNKEEANKDENI